ncbi:MULTISPECIES: M24 family metallopeptidase [Burkholderia]|uniref:M24 family metallopeptidase n=1 Tax=Burkholderia TaxID=32008 RepID=UPI000980DF39|nr:MULTISPECIES: Xaa-Pro peptidase family protein [Burkholderia]AQQ40221.1 peptidase M24 [Burkholderia cenocepacia]MBG0881906.1 aminopeptidase P family protein [Burkholderia sp. 9775_39]MBG0888833.1 aminopeptidase P family protein [Burkholderia sp. 9773_38]ONV25661.1 peptidase M24 [Burkholderia cenocepacia]ONV35520.1 peptidase M24 [Burkholderia cenocepacia]
MSAVSTLHVATTMQTTGIAGVSDDLIERVRAYRIERVRNELVRRNCPAIVLYDPVNIRYATDTSNMQIWTGRNPTRYVIVFVHGPVIGFEFHNCEHVWNGSTLDVELRGATCWNYFSSGPESVRKARQWAREVADLLRQHTPSEMRIAVDRLDPEGVYALQEEGVRVADGQALMEHARAVKSADELQLIKTAVDVCEQGIRRMHNVLTPGMSEQDLWAHLHYENIRLGGEWIETRLLASGPRTNPWMQECSARTMKQGELIAFDTDLVGPFGYCADISRTWTVGHVRPTDAQRRLYAAAYAQLMTNTDLLRPGMAFSEFAQRTWKMPQPYQKNRYSCLAHGIGMVDEYPSVAHYMDWDSAGYDGTFESGMTLCIESYIGAEGGDEGVKLEQQVLLTETGCVPLSTFPFETNWL